MTPKDSALKNVSETALWVAACRGEETDRPDPLFSDPLAKKLAGQRGIEILNQMGNGDVVRWNVLVRTCIIDRMIERAIAQGIDTILNLGAGLDTRPYRMALPKTLKWFEVDYHEMIAFKENNLGGEVPLCRLERAGFDLSDRLKRQDFFHYVNGSGKKVLIVAEGVITYLNQFDAGDLALDLRSEPNFQFWILDYLSSFAMRYLRNSAAQKKLENIPFQFNVGDWTSFFCERGWKIKELVYTAEEAKRLRRSFPLPLWMRLLLDIIPGPQRTFFRHSTGYALLEAFS